MKKLFRLEIVISIVFPLMVVLNRTIGHSIRYNNGVNWLDDEAQSFWWFLTYGIIYLASITVVFGILLFFLCKLQFKKVFILILMLSLSFYVSTLLAYKGQPGYIYFMKGYEYSIREKAPFDKIKEWLSSIQIPEQTQWLSKEDWPVFISTLSPNEVLIDITQDNIKYMRIIWGGPPGHYGIVVGVDSTLLPLDVFFVSEYRKDVEEDAFVWHELKRK